MSFGDSKPQLTLLAKEDIIEEDSEAKKMFLTTDGICKKCGAIINTYYENSCFLCDCGGKSFITGKISVEIRELLEYNIEYLRTLCDMYDIGQGSRSRMIVKIVDYINHNNKIDERLIKMIITRNNAKKNWFVSSIETNNNNIRTTRLKLVEAENVIISIH